MAETSKKRLYRELGEMKIGEQRWFRFDDMRFTDIQKAVKAFGYARKLAFKIEPDYYKGMGVTRVHTRRELAQQQAATY